MTTAEDTTEQAIAAGYHASTGDAPAGTSPFGGLAAASVIASNARAGDGIVYQEGGGVGWLMIPAGVQYYLGRDMRSGVPVPRELLAARTAPQTSQIDLAGCAQPAACLGSESRVWVVVSGDEKSPYGVIPQREASVLRQRYGPEPELIRHVKGLTVFLLVRT